jgi:glycosyltransferase involved in cell wall biosynthesis
MISIIIPVYNDPKGLRDTLESLVDQEYEDYEILPVDNNSNDNTAEVIEEFENKYPDLVKGYEENEVQGSYAARNKGVRKAKGDIICFLDADMWVDDDYLSKVSEYFNKTQVKYSGCNVKIISKKETIWARYNEATGFNIEESIENNFAQTCCLICKSEIFEKVGLFDDQLISGGDVEFGKRVNRSGFEQDFAESIMVYHPARFKLKDLISKNIRVGKGHCQLQERHPEIFKKPWYLSPEIFLPTKPWKFVKRIKMNEKHFKIGLAELISFFFISYFLKLLRTYGRVRADISNSNLL